MKQTTKKEIISLIDENTEIEASFLMYEDFDSFDELAEILENNGSFSCEIIHYSNAIDYLSEHDPSFCESLSIADEMGYECKNLSSEILASLLASKKSQEVFYDLQADIEAIIESTQEEEKKEEEN